MEPHLEKIREVQREAWNKSSKGWKKWDDMTMHFMKPMGDEIIRLLQLNENHHVLDVATGTGEPGLTIASAVNKGHVTGTDLAEEMLALAREHSEKRGLLNFDTVCCDVSALPFENNTFDAVSCRFGFMFFPDIQLALSEIRRVLKPGGRLAVSVWDLPEKNFWIANSMETMIEMLHLNPPAPGAPGLFRCANPGFMVSEFTQAGFKNIQENAVAGKLPCGTLETYWSFITEVACPAAFTKAEETVQQQIKEVVLRKVRLKYPERDLALDSGALVVCGIK